MENKEVKVFAPATVANLAVGYDILGLALESPGDEVIVRKGTYSGLKIVKITGDNGKLPLVTEKNTASYAALQLLKHLGKSDLPIEMEIHKKMAMGTGLGSSAASAVAGVYGVNAYLGHPLSKEEILRFAVEGEQKADGAFHADNVAPSLFGGIVLIRSNETLETTQLPAPSQLAMAMVYPHIEILTSESRAILSDRVSLDQVITQTGNIATFVAGLYEGDLKKIGSALSDVIIEPQRAHLIPQFFELKSIALENEALGFSISGAGPSLFAVCDGLQSAEQVRNALASHLESKGIAADTFVSAINTKGAYQIY